MTPQEKRKRTILERYGSFKNMLKHRDVRDLILGGYNGGKARTSKGFATWDEGRLSKFAKARERDTGGRFLPKTKVHPQATPEQTDR